MRMRVALLAGLATVPVMAPTPAAALDDLGGPGTAPLLALVGLLTWLCGGWLLLVLGLALLEQRPGRAARVAAALLPRVAPRAVRLAVQVALGTALVSSSLGSVAASATSSGHGPTAGAPAPFLDWPVHPPTPALDWPTAPSTAGPRTTETTALPPVRESLAVSTAPTSTTAASVGEVVVVQPGDCLWVVAERSLGAAATPARTAAAWPAWWSANRAVIGSDPDLLQPGTRLVPPA